MIDDSQLVEKLAKSDAISNKELRRGLELAKKDGTSLYEALISHDLADERILVKVVARILNVPPVWLGDRTPDADVTERIPRSLAVRNRVLPLKFEKSKESDRLVLAMIDPLDVLAMDEVASHTGVDVRPVVAGPYDLRGGLERAYGAGSEEEAGDEAASLEALEQAASGELEPDDDALDEEIPDDGLDDDSWAAFFDEAEDVDNTEDSSVISRDMKDRAISSVLDAVDPDSEPEEADEDDGLNSLDEPLSRSQITGGVSPDLDGWEVDSALDGEGDEDQENRDYAKIGHLFVYSPEKAAAQSEVEEVEADDEKAKKSKKKDKHKGSDASEASEPSEADEDSKAEADDESEDADAESADDEDSEADDDTSHTEFGLGPAALREQALEADDESGEGDRRAAEKAVAEKVGAKKVGKGFRSTNKNSAIVKDKVREMTSEASLNARFVEQLSAMSDLDDAGRKLLADASPSELIYAAVLALVDADKLDAAELLEYLAQK